MNTSQRLEARVEGQVQGVGFRWFVRLNASRLGLTGWVANQPDGSLRVVAEGSDDALDELVALLHQGPEGAIVRQVRQQRLAASNSFSRFEIRSAAHSGD